MSSHGTHTLVIVGQSVSDKRNVCVGSQWLTAYPQMVVELMSCRVHTRIVYGRFTFMYSKIQKTMSVVSTNAEAVKHRFSMGVCATVPHLPYIYCPIHSSKLAWYHSVITYSDLPLLQFTFE